MVSAYLEGIVFSGDFICEFLEPVKPIKVEYYKCDKKFYTDPVAEFFEEDTTKIGLLIIAGEDAYYYDIFGKHHIDQKLIYHLETFRNKKQKKGGQSAPRFQRIRLEQITLFVKKIMEYTIKYFREYDKIFIFSASDIKHQFLEYFNTDPVMKQKLVNQIYNIAGTNVELTHDIIRSNILSDDADGDYTEYFNDLLLKDILVYGMDDINKNLDDKILETIYIDKDQTELYEQIKEKAIDKCKIIRIKNTMVSNFGNILGVRFYV
jgi:peptide subunit release factor 1 (eRF1)